MLRMRPMQMGLASQMLGLAYSRFFLRRVNSHGKTNISDSSWVIRIHAVLQVQSIIIHLHQTPHQTSYRVWSAFDHTL